MSGSMALWVAVFIVALAALVKSADWFTEGSEELGLFLGLPVYVVGLTIVALGTSLPELISSIFAVARGSSEIVAGNVAGSNITNVLLVLAMGAILGGRLTADREILKVDLPILATATAIFGLACLDGEISRGDGALLFIGAVFYVFYGFVMSQPTRKTQDEIKETVEEEFKSKRGRLRPTVALKIVGGATILYFSAEYTIKSVVELSELLNIGKDVIAISAVALGTSLPELVVSVVAARRGKTEIAVANVLGSNVFNVFAVGGIPALIAPLTVSDSVLTIGLPFLAVSTVLCFFTAQDREVTRWEGIPLLLLYALFIGMLFGLF